MEFNIEDFLPKYPNITNFKDQVLNPYPDFYNSLYKKREFNELKLSATERKPLKGSYYKHQEAIARFLSPFTIYNALLLDHEMGTGKSCSAFAAIEQIKENSTAFKGALILSRGPRILSNLMNELAYVCTPGQYIPQNLERRALTEKERKRRLLKLVSAYYKFDTFQVFAKALQKMSDDEIIERYSNLIICIDEVHNLRIKTESTSYEQILRMLRLVNQCKIILMSGTPMKDDPSEIASILNLILPEKDALPTGVDFNNEYLNSTGTDLGIIYTVKEEKKALLKNSMKGRVSYLKPMFSNVKIIYEGHTMGTLTHFHVVPSTMSKLQTNVYAKAYASDGGRKSRVDLTDDSEEAKGGIYSHSRQATLFVYPDGKYGQDGFSDTFSTTKITSINKYNVKPGKSLLKCASRDSTVDEKLACIEQHSAIYATIIRSILANRTKLHFIYNSFVHGSGSIVLGKLLEWFGFKQSVGIEKASSDLRYAILTHSTTTQTSIEKIIKLFNDPSNLTGDYIQVIIGSRILTEGITLKNVREIHVATPHWNYSEISQAIARGVRLESHQDLINAGIDPTVRIYQHVAIPLPDMDVPSLDLEMYQLCECKDKSIKAVERLIKESAVDCAIFYERNRAHGKVDGSRECDYQTCDYKCDGIDTLTLTGEEIDYSTYNLYYKSETTVQIAISRFFLNAQYVHIDELVNYLSQKYERFDILSALKSMIVNNVIVKNNLGIDCYLREQSDVYFLVDSITVGNDFFSSVYVSHPVISEHVDFINAMDTAMLKMLEKSDIPGHYFEKLSYPSKKMIVQFILLTDVETTQISLLRDYLTQKRIILSPTKYILGNLTECFMGGEWTVCEDEPEDKYCQDVPDSIDKKALMDATLTKAEIKAGKPLLIGQCNPTQDSFCIEKFTDTPITDARKKNPGINCKSITVSNLTNYMKELNMDSEQASIDAGVVDIGKSTVEQKCKAIKAFMKRTGRLYKNAQCGSSLKTRKEPKKAE